MFDQKYGFRDYRGGGRSSGRETIGRVAAGAIATKILKEIGIDYMKPRSLFDSGKIDYINTRSKELGITAKDFIYNPEYAEEVRYRFGYNLQQFKASFIKKYEDYLV